MNTQYADLTLDEKTYTSLIYTILALLILIFFSSASLFIPTAQDIVLQYGQESKESLVATHIQNGRYIPAVLLLLIRAYGYDYFNTIGFWILGFSIALWFCTREFVRYIKLPYSFTPLLTLMIGLHGFWSELIPSLIAYLDYTSGLIASGLALLCGRYFKNQHLLSTSLVTLCLWIALASYPPMALIPLFAALLALIRDSFLEKNQQNRRGIRTILPLFLGFSAGYILSLVTSSFFDYSPIGAAHTTFPQSILSLLFKFLPYSFFLPLHERIFYGLAQISTVALAFSIHSWRSQLLVLSALMVGFLMSGGLLEWPERFHQFTLTNRIPAVFFHVGLVIILGVTFRSIMENRHPQWSLHQLGAGALLTFVLLSGGNQLSHLMERWWHYEHDYAIASGIVADLRDVGRLREGEKIAFVSKNPILTHAPISAFLSHDEIAVPFLKRVSGFTFKEVPRKDLTDIHYEILCTSRHTPWDIHYKNDIIFICLSSLDRKAPHDTARGQSS